jgi:hypothetical protein
VQQDIVALNDNERDEIDSALGDEEFVRITQISSAISKLTISSRQSDTSTLHSSILRHREENGASFLNLNPKEDDS